MPTKTAAPESPVDQIIGFASERAKAFWSHARQPYLVSSLGSDLKSAGIDYREILGDQTLGGLFSSREADVKLVRHPVHRAKIGLIPAEETFEYSTEEVAPGSDQIGLPFMSEKIQASPERRPRNARHVVMNFLEALGSLPEEELRRVDIPVSVLAKLVTGR